MGKQIPLVLLSILAASSLCWAPSEAKLAFGGDNVGEMKNVANIIVIDGDNGRQLFKKETGAQALNSTSNSNTTHALPDELQTASATVAPLSLGQSEQETTTLASTLLADTTKIIDEIVGESSGGGGERVSSSSRNELEEEVSGGGESGAGPADDDSVISASEILPNPMRVRPSWLSSTQSPPPVMVENSSSSSPSLSSTPELTRSKHNQIIVPANRILFPINAPQEFEQNQNQKPPNQDKPEQQQHVGTQSNRLLVFHQVTTTPKAATAPPTIGASSSGGGLNEHLLQVAAAAAIGNELEPLTDQENRLDDIDQQRSRYLLQILVLGLFTLVSGSLIIIYTVKFCLCRRGKERRLLRRALIGDLATSNGMPRQSQLPSSLVTTLGLPPPSASQQHINNAAASLLLAGRHQPLSGASENFLLSECVCQLDPHQTNNSGSLGQNIDCIGGLHYFPATSLSRGSTPNSTTEPSVQASAPTATSPIQQNSLVLSLLDRLQQTICAQPMLAQHHHQQPLTADATSSSGEHQHHHLNVIHNNQQLQQQQQQLAQLIVAQLQAQLMAAGCLQAACMCNQQHQLLASEMPANRPPAYSDLFRHHNQQQQQQQRQVTESVATTAVAGSNEDA